MILVCLLVQACSEAGDAKLETYRERIANVLQLAPVTPLASNPAPRLPRQSALNASSAQVAAHDMDLLDFFALYGCDLQLVVAEQNAALGKVARPSQKLLFHLRFLSSAPACLAQLRQQPDKAELATQLEQALESKREQLPVQLWQAVLGAEEARAFWRLPAHLGDYPAQTGREPVDAIAVLQGLVNTWLAGDYDADHDRLESALADLRKGDGGALLKSWQLVDQQMRRLVAEVAPALVPAQRCQQGRLRYDKAILDNVVAKFLVGEVQPWAAALNTRYYALIEPYIALEQSLAAGEPAAYHAWREARAQFFERARAAIKAHVMQLTALQQPCA